MELDKENALIKISEADFLQIQEKVQLYNCVAKAIKKELPQDIKRKDFNIEKAKWNCPACNYSYTEYDSHDKYCRNCGQKLKWITT